MKTKLILFSEKHRKQEDIKKTSLKNLYNGLYNPKLDYKRKIHYFFKLDDLIY